MKKVAVVLSGCGHENGTDPVEAASCALALSELRISISYFGPQSVLDECARLVSGSKPVQVASLETLKESDFDAVVFPGGQGAASRLSTWAHDGAKFKVDREVVRIIKQFHKASKPIGALSYGAVLVARVFGSEAVNLTLGNDPGIAAEVSKTGAYHVICPVTDFVSDRDHKVLSSPATMSIDAPAFDIYIGTRKLIRELNEMA